MSGAKIIEGLKQAAAGDLSRVRIDGQTWVRADALHADQQEIMRINNAIRSALLQARQYVADAGSDEDPETQRNSAALLAEIDAVVQ